MVSMPSPIVGKAFSLLNLEEEFGAWTYGEEELTSDK